ncbi:MAG: 4Fe-4S dicluster domain-containing protein [Deltaproteobacteria bacterium]|nr:4Fe-4S dicluster domain-containing protein [Deltaproteobacteria bacterium]
MAQEILQLDYQFLDQVEAAGPFDAGACFQCRKCTNGCPVTFAMDLFPDEVIRLVILGQREKVLNCRTIWVCAACETCTTRCPNGVKIAELMDRLKEMAIEEGVPSPQPQIFTLHRTFLNNIKRRGRIFEATLLPIYMLRSGALLKKWNEGTWYDEMKLGWKMFYKGRMPVFPKGIKGKKEVRKILTQSKKTKSKS